MNVPLRLPVLPLCAVLVVATGNAIAAQTTPGAHFPTNEDLRHTRAIADPRLSPDGRMVLFAVTEPTVDSATTHFWLADVATNTSRQITFAPAGTKSSERDGTWSPDGRAVYFVAKRSKHSQLYRLPLNGGEAQAITMKIVPSIDASAAPDAVDGSAAKASRDSVEIDVADYSVAPDGRTAAIVARDPDTPGEEKQNQDRADAHAIDQDIHGSRAYLFNFASSKLTPIAIAPDIKEVVWSHRGDRLAVVTSPMNNVSDLGPSDTLWIVDVANPGAPRRLAESPTTAGKIVWSPSDARLFFAAQAAADTPPGYSDLYVVPLAGGGIRNLSSGYSGSVNSPDLAETEETVIASVANGTRTGYARFAVAGGPPVELAMGHAAVASLQTNDRRSAWVYLAAGTDEPTALYVASSLGGAATRVSAPATADASWPAVKARVVHWKNDGRTIDGLLYLPPEAARGKVPLVVDVHGGPLGAWLEYYSAFAQFLIGRGWAVLMPNPRGSSGRGAAFAAANKNDLGGGDYRDIMAGVDYAIANQPIDANKLAVFGYSYGGEMAAFIEGKTDRFKAIVSCAPVIDQFSEYGTENGSWYDRWYFGKPWEQFADAWRQSPLAGASHAKTPFLLLQGESDLTDPIGQSQEMYRALRQAGVSVQLVTYPRDDHGPLSRNIVGGPSPEPWHGFDARQRIVKFYESAFGR
ncbi:MAG TPA: alpha/beta fold hydrolase [Gemmatimonadaceae bacterium]|nr:alpha/beta fold hydrolase [Gemmatimonadaceae bacterium]